MNPDPSPALVLANGIIVDGTGAPGHPGSVVVEGGQISRLIPAGGELPPGEVVDVDGQVIAPGFIDVHHHAHNEMEGGVLHVPYADNMLRQGVTTLVGGNCGSSPWPIGEHLEKAGQLHPRTNYALLVGHSVLRRRARDAGLDPRADEGIAHMKRDLEQALGEGAVGMSSGQANAGQDQLPTAEVIELCKVLAEHGRVYAVHMRDEADMVFDCVREAVTVARESGARVEISHLKLIGWGNWGRAEELLALVRAARDEGLAVAADAYPYPACYGGIWAMAIPHFEKQGASVTEATRTAIRERIASLGGPERIRVAQASRRKSYVGLTLAEISAQSGLDPVEVVVDLALNGSASCIGFLMDEGDVARIVSHPETTVVSDGQLRLLGVGISHPRNYGTFPRVLARYVREEGRLTLEQAVRKMTSLPAERFGFTDRGVIREGAVADITVFDPATVQDKATFENPFQYPEGITHVLISGRWAVRDGATTEEGMGEVVAF